MQFSSIHKVLYDTHTYLYVGFICMHAYIHACVHASIIIPCIIF